MWNQVQKATAGAVLATSMFVGTSEFSNVSGQEVGAGVQEHFHNFGDLNFGQKRFELASDTVKLVENSSQVDYKYSSKNIFTTVFLSLMATGMWMKATAEKLTANLK